MKSMVILLTLFCISCSADKNLGNGYYLFKDGVFTSIVYTTKLPYRGTGVEVIPYQVIKTDFNDRYIWAITLDDKHVVKSYWIIDKNIHISFADCHDQRSCDSLLRSNVVGPLDSLSFLNQLRERDITLKFKQ